MRKEIFQTIEIPEGVEVKLEDSELIVKGKEGENKKKFNLSKIDFEIKDNKITLGNKKSTKKEKKRINTFRAHIENMIKGVQEKFEYNLKVCFHHFPMTVTIREDDVEIKNFLGEKIPRIARLPKGAEIKVDKEFITVTSIDKEIAGQAAANLETATRITNKDRRVFQDGIFIINKAGKVM
ncbi:50S ribosomal protein L6 [archaeon]|jgi:large subunit ribosomal protein L6|nr:50S ribosomal protein L6 [archaeon]MBT4373150.1 50S ribosomal protein L6 [archaeon]MBT4531495.1 50S ribosomal protein L6 [archaeon]MBT7001327.1 50S ribosomal protein L6 [archaeon]MBT7282187.1 50S ribosomal protein L6 [archaeon]